MKQFLKRLLKKRYVYEPLITVEVRKDALMHNLREFQKIAPDSRVAPVLKSNAYGHGLVQVAQLIDPLRPPFIVVDSYFEAVALRSQGITSPLLIIGYTPVSTMVGNKLKNISFTIISLSTLHALPHISHAPITIHLKIDTGMSRQGLLMEEVPQAISLLKQHHGIILEGIASHFADADNFDPTFSKSQIDKWNTVVDLFLKQFPQLRYYHVSATAGHAYVKEIKANISRAGLGLFGLEVGGPVDARVSLQPVMSVKTVVASIKKIPAGSSVGYGRTFTAPKDMTIATLPIGYAEGVDRRLSNKGVVQIHNHYAPIIGRVSMDITTVDVSGIKDVNIDDPVVVMSAQKDDKNSINSIARTCGTIPYEILVHVNPLLKRVVV